VRWRRCRTDSGDDGDLILEPRVRFLPRDQELLRRAAESSGLPAFAAVVATEADIAMIDNFAFGPPELTVFHGTTVIWLNHDDFDEVFLPHL
jgi:hypothetical protein